jgi:hypothetical protein
MNVRHSPRKWGIQYSRTFRANSNRNSTAGEYWMPAFAGMTAFINARVSSCRDAAELAVAPA